MVGAGRKGIGVGYEVVIEAMRKASTAAGDAAEAAGKVELGAAVDDVATAMPGSRSGPAATALASTWTGQVTSWSTDAGDYAKNLSSAADRYATDEAAAEADLRSIG